MITLALAAFVLPVQVSGHIPSHAVTESEIRASYINPSIAGYLRNTDVRVASNVRYPAAAPVPIDTVMRVAVRFFDPDLIMNGRIWTHVCTSINAVRELPGRNLGFEAFSFGTII